MERLKMLVEKTLEQNWGESIKITDQDFKEAVEEIGKDVLYNYLVFGKDVPFELFLRNLQIYILGVKKLNYNQR
ncbi:hypothetical protein [Caloranaerobacter azorensis]|uniref:Uncharacterized protein n=3 Tax=Caloranaerobacter azorensis TaxID=116090 RepID=A0A1M5UJX4_9FIRM|nr:hypothetical protein [Caloranaerobacter azorensis]KGG80941.1 hypothetical protein Y919_03280 [Caloranaerobacter azorensis H53214]QIB27543.1 hypothetical protein G3A45_09740 [Caloranaerobacter azorensis]SHH63372.1 hypothetical protein SAMN02745135_01463 [Caloranaerobacter azorensis DSM 13643]